MPKKLSNKNTTLCLLEIFERYTSPGNGIMLEEIINYLADNYGIIVERKTIYREIEKFNNSGIYIEKEKGKHTTYYLDNERLVPNEARFLIDVLGTRRNLSAEHFESMRNKIRSTQIDDIQNAIDDEAHHEVVDIDNNPFDILRYVDDIQNAIRDSKVIRFRLMEHDSKGDYVVLNDGEFVCFEPKALLYRNDMYYLYGYNQNSECIDYVEMRIIIDLEIRNERARNITPSIEPLNRIRDFEVQINPKYLSVLYQNFEEIRVIDSQKSIYACKTALYEMALLNILVLNHEKMRVVAPFNIKESVEKQYADLVSSNYFKS